jgi:dUTP pyrophosphatase
MTRHNLGIEHRPTIQISLEEGAVLPEYKTAGSAGLDLACNEDFRLDPHQRCLVGTGVRIAVPFGYEAQVRPRSGLAIKHGITMVNTPGTIDSDYRGEVKVILLNTGSEAVEFKKGDRIAQIVICPIAVATLEVVEVLDETVRSSGGFGSTGV